MIKKFVSYWWKNAKEAFDLKENWVWVVGVALWIFSQVCKREHWKVPFGETATDIAEIGGIALAVCWCFLWMPFKRHNEVEEAHKVEKEKLVKAAEKPTIAIETLLQQVDVVDMEAMIANQLVLPPRTKKVNQFYVKVRNQSTFAVNIDTIGLTIKDRNLRSMFWIPSGDGPNFPRQLASRSSLVMQFGHVETTGPNDVDEIDGVYVETGCGNVYRKQDNLFHEWSKTADLKPMQPNQL